MKLHPLYCLGFVLGLALAAGAIHVGTQSVITTPGAHASGLDTAH